MVVILTCLTYCYFDKQNNSRLIVGSCPQVNPIPHSIHSQAPSPPHYIGRKYSSCIDFGDINYKRLGFIDKLQIRIIKVFVF